MRAPELWFFFVRIDPIRFLAGCRKRRLNYRVSLVSLGLVFGVFCVYNFVLIILCNNNNNSHISIPP